MFTTQRGPVTGTRPALGWSMNSSVAQSRVSVKGAVRVVATATVTVRVASADPGLGGDGRGGERGPGGGGGGRNWMGLLG